jgi:hypothetical protein
MHIQPQPQLDMKGFLIFVLNYFPGKLKINVTKYKSLKIFAVMWLKKPFFRDTTLHQRVLGFQNFDAKQ